MQETAARDNKEYKRAMKINTERLAQAKMGTPTYALVMYHRSLIFNLEHNSSQEMSCLALSSISDIQSAIMDHEIKKYKTLIKLSVRKRSDILYS